MALDPTEDEHSTPIMNDSSSLSSPSAAMMTSAKTVNVPDAVVEENSSH